MVHEKMILTMKENFSKYEQNSNWNFWIKIAKTDHSETTTEFINSILATTSTAESFHNSFVGGKKVFFYVYIYIFFLCFPVTFCPGICKKVEKKTV